MTIFLIGNIVLFTIFAIGLGVLIYQEDFSIGNVLIEVGIVATIIGLTIALIERF